MVGLSFKPDASPYRPLVSAPRSLSTKFFALFAVVSIVYFTHAFVPSEYKSDLSSFRFSSSSDQHAHTRGTCPPRAYAAGKWLPAPSPTNRTQMSEPGDVYEFLGFQGCASSREVYWHLAADKPALWDRFPTVASWRWQPPPDCDVRQLDSAAIVKDLVERGGWLLIGDSVTENHFFSLSCLLFPHVRATPDYVANPYFDRAWPQHLYLEPSSPLVQSIRFPPGFDVATTPLVTFRRVDLLFEQPQLDTLYHSLHPDSAHGAANESIFSDEAAWNVSPAEYVKLFTAPLPHGNYGTMVVSTGGHWTTTLFAGLKDTSAFKDGIANVVGFFSVAMEAWAREVQTLLDDAEEVEWASRRPQVGRVRGRNTAPRQVVVRAYLPGHEDCHDRREPWRSYTPGRWGWYNWNQIGEFNDAFEAVLASHKYPDIHFLPIDRPALLRPDAHSAGDCLHIMTGAGVLEGWTQYIWHYVTVEIPARIR